MQNETALSILRAFNGYSSQKEGFYASLLAQHLEDKEIPLDIFRFMKNENIPVGTLVRDTLMRGKGNVSANEMDFIVKMIYAGNSDLSDLDIESYDGSVEHTRVMDQSLTLFNEQTFFIGENAMANFVAIRNILSNASLNFRQCPIAILGRGPAGVMMNAALRIAGFQNITTYDKHGSSLGIWGQPNVAGGTKNNPRPFDFAGFAALSVAQGNGTRDGKTVAEFVRLIGQKFDLYHDSPKVSVTKVIPEDLKHIIHTEGADKQTAFNDFPIVINCIGTGKPREFSDKKRMTLEKNSTRPVAVRWQQILAKEDVQDQRIAIIGLGNSTAEMMSQLNEFRNAGVNCDYKIFTHYPEESVLNPMDSVYEGSRYYRVFRDLSKPDLTGFQGDLPRARQDYYRALREDRIVPGVTQWGVREGNKYLSTNVTEYRYDKLFVLTGYKQDTKELEERFGLDCDPGFPAADYDGEFRKYGEIMKGYFGLGALMDSPHDPNSVVIPGMLFRLPDMLFTIVCRAAEHAASKRN